MTAEKAEKILKERGVDYYIYNIGGKNRSSECIVIENRKGEWVTYIWERSEENSLKVYPNEDIAARAFLDRFLRLSK